MIANDNDIVAQDAIEPSVVEGNRSVLSPPDITVTAIVGQVIRIEWVSEDGQAMGEQEVVYRENRI